MDYIERLEESYKKIEKDAEKISQISLLVEAIESAEKEIASKEKLLNSCEKKIEEATKEMTDEKKKVMELIDVEIEGRGETLSIIKSGLASHTKDTLDSYDNLHRKISSNIDIVKSELQADIGKSTLATTEEATKIKEKMQETSDANKKFTQDVQNVILMTVEKQNEAFRKQIDEIMKKVSIVVIVSSVAACTGIISLILGIIK